MKKQVPWFKPPKRRLFLLFGILAGMFFLSDGRSETTSDESRLFRFGQDSMKDSLYELAETKFQDLLNQFPQSEFREEAVLQLARARLNQGRWGEAISTLEPYLENASVKWQDDYLLVMGEAYLKGERGALAMKTFQKLIQKHPKSRYIPQARYGIARGLLQDGKMDAAQEMLRELQKDGGEWIPRATLTLGVSQVMQKKYDSAAELLNRLVKEEKNSEVGFQAMFALGEMDFERKNFDGAKGRYEALTKSERAEAQAVIPMALMRLGQIEAGNGNRVGASASYEAAFQRSREPVFRLGCVEKLEDLYLKLEKGEALIDKLKAWSQEYSKSWLGEALYMEMGTVWLKAGNRDQAIRVYQEFLEKFPDSRLENRVHYQLGWVFLEDQKHETAAAEFQKAVDGAEQERDISLQMEALLKLGDLHFDQKQFEAASSAYMKATRLQDADPELLEKALYQAAYSHFKCGRTDETRKLQSAHGTRFSQGHHAPEFLMLAADAYRKDGELEKVAEVYRQLLERYPQSSHAARAWAMLAETQFAAGKYKESMEVVSAFIDKNPKHEWIPRVLLIRGRCLERLEQFDKAVLEFEGLIKNYPKSPMGLEARFWLGSYYNRQKNYARAQEQFELLRKQAAPQDPLVPEATYFAALAAYRLGQNKDDAPRLLNALVKEYPQSPWVFDGRFLYGDILTERGQFEDALLIFEDLCKKTAPDSQAPQPEQVLEAQGRRGQCLRQLNRLNDAKAAFRMILDARLVDSTLRNQAHVEMAKTYELMGDFERALENHLAPLYEYKDESTLGTRDHFWICKGAFEAVRLLEERKNWQGAAGVLKRLVESGLPCKKEAEDRLRQLKLKHADVQ